MQKLDTKTILAFNSNELAELDTESLKKVVKTLGDTAKKRLKRAEEFLADEENINYTFSSVYIDKYLSGLDSLDTKVKGKSKDELIAQASEIKDFLNLKSSTIRGLKKTGFGSDFAEGLDELEVTVTKVIKDENGKPKKDKLGRVIKIEEKVNLKTGKQKEVWRIFNKAIQMNALLGSKEYKYNTLQYIKERYLGKSYKVEMSKEQVEQLALDVDKFFKGEYENKKPERRDI